MKLFTDRILKNENWAYLWINILTFYVVFFIVCPSRGLSKYVKTKFQTTCFYFISSFLKKTKRCLELFPLHSLCLIFCKIFEEEYFSGYVLLTDRILLSDCLFSLRCWAIYMYCNCLFSRLWRHKLFAFQVVTS